MAEKSTDPSLTCGQKSRIGDVCKDEPPYYKVPFILGMQNRMVPEWWCESCIDEGPEFERDGTDVYLSGGGPDESERLAEAEEVLENGVEETLGW